MKETDREWFVYNVQYVRSFPLIVLAVLLDAVHVFYRLIRNTTAVYLSGAGGGDGMSRENVGRKTQRSSVSCN